ncbi:protein disulfide isomerase [Rickenella mellea]|uniref:protein disulfide-isomerase n=1 Tax=Rickenella mellea TaxID=50990 RepID=A0A4Y7PMD4_9AGAM|nr:protein disulfide isomerase [Rickenella mellea]
MLPSISLLVLAFVSGIVTASNVAELTPDNFDSVVGKGAPALVEFFAPWCGHCKNLAPIWEQLADAYVHAKDKVVIAKVDADGAGRELGQKYGVTGFPTLKWFNADGGEPETYDGARDLEALAAFVTKKSGVKSNIKPPPPPATKILTTRDFNEVVLDEKNDVLVAFTAPWCGHCKRMKPIYEKVAETFKPEKHCILANVDADAKANEKLAREYEITSFPTIMFFPRNNGTPIDYDGPREEEGFVSFLNEKCGTKRAVGGGLNADAGRVSELDALAEKFFGAVEKERVKVLKEAEGVAGKVGKEAQHYLKVMKKVVDGSEEYLAKESARLASILQKRTLSAEKLDEIKIKANILSAFAEKKAEEVKEEVKEQVEEVKEEAKKLKEEL